MTPRSSSSALSRSPRQLVGPYVERMTTPPTDLDAIARQLDVREVLSAEMHADGELRRRGAGFTIVVSSTQGAARRRFSLAHELAHVIVTRLKGRIATGERLERLCDDIAAEMLMPAALFRSDAGARPDADQIRRLARRYRTSMAATAMRCAELTRISAFEYAEGSVVWQKRIPAGLARALVEAVGPAVSARGTYETTFEIEEEDGHRRVQVIGLGAERSLWVLVPQTVAERVVQPTLLVGATPVP
jgi:IrrE N-terminal-like domain